MKTANPSTTTVPTTTTDPQRPRVYWVLKQWGGRSAATAARYGVSIYENPFEHEGMSKNGDSTPQELMKRLRELGWKTAQFTNSSEKFARVEVTRAGFNVTYFPSYASALKAHKGEPSEPDLCACPFCRLADQLEIINWENERADGSEYSGDAVRCNRCDAIAPMAAWASSEKRSDAP